MSILWLVAALTFLSGLLVTGVAVFILLWGDPRDSVEGTVWLRREKP